MGLFSRKKEVPDLPPAPPLPELPHIPGKPQGLPELPSFPSNSQNENLNQEMVKSAVSDGLSSGEEEVMGMHSEDLSPAQAPQGILPPTPTFPIPQKPNASLLPGLPTHDISADENAGTTPQSPRKILPQMSQEPIFVRLDKFEESRKSLNVIKEKVTEIESMLTKIKKVKDQEDTELKRWSEEMGNLKTRLAEIDDGIFSQI